MAISNVRSAEYRAAGGRSWNRVKSGNRGIRFSLDEKKQTRLQRWERQQVLDAEDAYLNTKAAIKAALAEGYDESLVTVVK